MPIHDFNFQHNGTPQRETDQRLDPRDGKERPEQRPAILQRGDLGKEALPRDDIWFERQNVDVSQEVREILPVGYRTMDRGLKNYFAGMPVPTRDGTRIMQVRVAGGDRPYLVWAQDLRLGRVTLPVMSIKRVDDAHNPEKFSPAHFHWMSRRFLDSDCSRIALAFRPVAALVNYTLSVWGEHKRDLEYVNYQVRRRFHPAAEFMVEDEHLRGSVFLKYNGETVAVDDEVPADQRANKRMDFSVSMEAWLPLPEKVVPSILGTVTSLKETSGALLETVSGRSDLPVVSVRTGA